MRYIRSDFVTSNIATFSCRAGARQKKYSGCHVTRVMWYYIRSGIAIFFLGAPVIIQSKPVRGMQRMLCGIILLWAARSRAAREK